MKNIVFLGYGKMGRALAVNLDDKIRIIRRSFEDKFPKNYRADLVFLCIKPQGAKEILTKFSNKKIFHKNTIFISILAGKNIAFFEKIFGKDAKIIRSMPNLPVQYSQGIFAYLANKNLTKLELSKLKKIFTKFGTAIELKNEKNFDIFTAIFGSGPAYIFLLQGIFDEIASSISFNENDRRNLIKKLFLGSVLMSEFSNDNFSDLRESVTSKNGTTQAALKILQKKSALKTLFKKAIDAGITKSRQLSSL